MKAAKRYPVLWLLSLILPALLSAQQSAPIQDATDLLISRQELQELLARYDSILGSPGTSDQERVEATRAASLIRSRLEEGDFRAGDRIAIRLAGAPESFPDTLLVEPGPIVILPDMGEVSLDGILRSEAQEHLTAEIGRYVRNPDLYVQPLVRLSVQGAVRQPGYYMFPTETLLGDVLMAAGGPQQDSNLDDVRIRRGEELLMRGGEVQAAIDTGLSIDQVGLRAGDEINIPQRTVVLSWETAIRWGVIIFSTLLLGVRIF